MGASGSPAPLVFIESFNSFKDNGNGRKLYADDRLHLSPDGYALFNGWTKTALDDMLDAKLPDCVIWRNGECKFPEQFEANSIVSGHWYGAGAAPDKNSQQGATAENQPSTPQLSTPQPDPGYEKADFEKNSAAHQRVNWALLFCAVFSLAFHVHG